MRVTRVAFVDWIQDRVGRCMPGSLLPPTMNYWQPEHPPLIPVQEVAPPAQEPNKGVYFDAWA